MKGGVEGAVAAIRKGARAPIYLLHGDEYLAKEGAKAIVAALVRPGQESLSVETLTEDAGVANLYGRLATPSLFGGTKVVVIHDSRAFVSGQSTAALAKKSRELWQAGDADRALRHFGQLLAAAGQGADFLERVVRVPLPDSAWEELFDMEAEPEAQQWLQEMAARTLASPPGAPPGPGAGAGRVYEEVLERGIPTDTVLVVTAEAVDERRALYKRIGAAGCVIDCGVRSKRAWDTQMDPEAARAAIRARVQDAGKSIDPEAAACIVERTGSGMRGLESELEKILLFVGDRQRVAAADVLEVLSSSREASIFDLTNAVGERDAGRAVRALRSLLIQREPIPLMLNTLAGEIRNLIIARTVMDGALKGALDPALTFPAFRARVLPRLEQAGADVEGVAALRGMNPFRAFNLLRGAARFSMRELVAGLEAVHDADMALKTSGMPENLVLEPLLLRLCGGGAPAQRGRP